MSETPQITIESLSEQYQPLVAPIKALIQLCHNLLDVKAISESIQSIELYEIISQLGEFLDEIENIKNLDHATPASLQDNYDRNIKAIQQYSSFLHKLKNIHNTSPLTGSVQNTISEAVHSVV